MISRYETRKGPADPFRGNWYVEPVSWPDAEAATVSAMEQTYRDYLYWQQNWEEMGWEWSVFEIREEGEQKIWEGYKCMKVMESVKAGEPQPQMGWIKSNERNND